MADQLRGKYWGMDLTAEQRAEAVSRAHPLVQQLAKLIAAQLPTCELCEERPVPQGEKYCLTCAARFVPCAYCHEPVNLSESVTIEGPWGVGEVHPACHPLNRDEQDHD